MTRTVQVALVVAVTVATAVAAAYTIAERDTRTRTWAAFCNEAYLIAQENRTRLPDGTARAGARSLEQVEELAAQSPSDALADDLRTAAPALARPYATGGLVLTSPILAATTRADTALVDHCEVGRSVFDPGNLQHRPAAN
jgi:hypothetical protein